MGKTYFIPTRLIEITNGGLNGTDPPTVRIVDNTDLEEIKARRRRDYVALSHCWGHGKTPEFTKLLISNLDAFKKSIPFDQLPPNFQHAIIITTQLGYAYLWVDSLCIIQKSEEDWKAEAPNMGLVYANAICTISASSSPDPFGGCFSERDPFSQDCLLRAEGDDGSALIARSPLRRGAALDDDMFQNLVNLGPLNSRGWAFQERILSRRLLHFCKGIVLFECNTLRASEYHEEGVQYSRRANVRADGSLHTPAMLDRLAKRDRPYRISRLPQLIFRAGDEGLIEDMPYETLEWVTNVLDNPDYETQQEKRKKLLDISASSGIRGSFHLMIQCSKGRMGLSWPEKVEWHQSWYDLVGQYSTRDLTFKDHDKLMAFVGISSSIIIRGGAGGDWTFVSGLWLNLLPLNLLWFRDNNGPCPLLAARPNRRIPTWSWASVDGKISHRLKTETSSSSSSQEDWGRQKGTRKKIFETTWKEITPLIDEKNIAVECENRDKDEIDGVIHNARLGIQPLCRLVDLKDYKTKMDVHVDFDFDFGIDDKSSSPRDGALGLALLRFRNTHVKPLKSVVQLHGIVVVKAAVNDDDTDALYRRIGYFWTADMKSVEDMTTSKEQQPGRIWLI